MGTDPLDSTGRGLRREPVLGPNLEEMEAAGPRATYLWRQEVKSEGKKPRSRTTTKALSEAEMVMPMVSYPPGQGGSRWEEGTSTMADYIDEMEGEDEGEEKRGEVLGPNQGAEEREPLLGLSLLAAPAPPDLVAALPSAKEECSATILESIEETGQGLPLAGSTGLQPLVGILKDAELDRETEETVNKRETTEKEPKESKEEVVLALESCCTQVKEPLEEVECPTYMEPYDQEVEDSEGEEEETTAAVEEINEEKEQMGVEEPEEEQRAALALESCCIPMEEPPEEPECPICTEPYDQEVHRPAPLNCSHVLCGRCLRAIMEAGSAADIGRVRCPICRQKTPMMEWEICRLQEELLLLGASEGPAQETHIAASLLFRPLPPRRPGFWGGLEHRFRVRFLTSRTVGCLPCLRYPPGLVQSLERLEGRCRWGYRLALLALTAADALSLLLVFLPIALLLLLFLIMDQ